MFINFLNYKENRNSLNISNKFVEYLQEFEILLFKGGIIGKFN